MRITARAAQALAMTLHELATNAAKYVEFSTKTGQFASRGGSMPSAAGWCANGPSETARSRG